MKRLTFNKYLTTFFLFLLFLANQPNGIAYANSDDNIFNCIENNIGCAEDENENPAVDQEPEKTAVGLSAWDYIQTLLALLFVIGLLFGLLKFFNRKNRMYNRNRLMKNMGGISLGQNKSIQLVVIGDAHYLIGVGDDIRLLKEVTDPEELAKLSSFYEEAETDSANGLLERLLAKITKTGKEKHENTEVPNFGQLFTSRLDEMKEERKRQVSRLTEKERNGDE